MTGTPLPWWGEALTALLVLAGAAFAAIGSFGLLRLPDFFQRIHAPTLGATGGVWCIAAAAVIYFSVQTGSVYLHALLVALFVALTAPVTTIFLMRATLFRHRSKEDANADPPPPAPPRP